MKICAKKRFCSLALSLMVFAFSAIWLTTPAAAGYSDIANHWARERIERWSDSGVLSGYQDGTFRPGKQITRAELSSILYRMTALTPTSQQYHYEDLKPGTWYYDAVTTMHALGVTLNTGDRMYPGQALTREEAVYMIAKTFMIGEDRVDRSGLERFSDRDQIDGRFSGRIGAMVAGKYISGYPDGTFAPRKTITRAEVMTVIDGVVDLYVNKPGEYSVTGGQTVVVNCGGAVITGKRDGGNAPAAVCLMGPAAEGDVTLKGTAGFEVRSVSREKPEWKTSGGCAAEAKDALVMADLPEPDLRFAGGNGQFASPYVISTPEQLCILGNPKIYEVDAYYCLDRDIDMGELIYPIGKRYPNCPMVWLDGRGHTITYRMSYKTRGPYYGLFEQWYGECSNLTLAGTVDFTFRPDGTGFKPAVYNLTFGGWAGDQRGGAYRNVRCEMDLTINGGDSSRMRVGGLTGTSADVCFENCTAAGKVTANFEAVGSGTTLMDTGGLSGHSIRDTYIGCTASGTVRASSQGEGAGLSEVTAGGLTGRAQNTSLTSCTFSGTVDVSSSDPSAHPGAAGLVGNGYNDMRFTRCAATGTVSVRGGDHSSGGGLAAFLSFSYKEGELNYPDPADVDFEERVGVIQNCWSTAAITSEGASFQSDCGGLVGQLSPAVIRTSWARPTVTMKGPSFQNIGGIAGSGYWGSIVENCWANAQGCATGGPLHSGGVVGRLSDSTVTNCYAIGTGKFSPENAITFEAWNDGTVSGCIDLTRASQTEQSRAFRNWDFTKVWDKKQAFPVLRDGDRDRQLAAQKS